MNKSILFFSLIFGLSFANQDTFSLDKKNFEKQKDSFYYLRFAAAETNITDPQQVVPGLGLGYRRVTTDYGLDISISGLGKGKSKNSQYLWNIPKVTYLRYLSPESEKTFYYGAGLSWGGIARGNNSYFIGIIPSFALGYELTHNTKILNFVELDISQPLISVATKGKGNYSPVFEFYVGTGF